MRGRPALPVAEIGKLRLPQNSTEANRCREITGIVKGYAARHVSRPLSVAVFGPPGSGKSFCVEQIVAEAGCDKPYIINLSQLSHPHELAESLKEQINSTPTKFAGESKATEAMGANAPEKTAEPVEQKKTRVFFFDEFDASLNGVSLGWLRWFLAPMQDGNFFLGGQPIEVGKAVFMFAGGTAVSLSEFEKRALEDQGEYRDKKVPDFISRLRGFIDIEGINSLDDKRPLDGRLCCIGFSTIGGLTRGKRTDEANSQSLVQLPDNELRKLHLSRGLLDGKIIGISAGQKIPRQRAY